MSKLKVLFLISFLIVFNSSYASDETMDSLVENTSINITEGIKVDWAEIKSDGSVITEDGSIEENNVVWWEAQVTDTQTSAWDVIVNEWTETQVTPLNSASNEVELTNINEENNWNWSNIETFYDESKVEALPTTWTTEILLLIFSLIIWSLFFVKKVKNS